MVFYDRFLELCAEKGVRPTNACVEAGLSRGLAAKWKATKTEKPSADALEKMAKYFGKSIDEILLSNNEKAPTDGEREISEEDIKLALFGGAGEVTDAMWDEAQFAIQLIKERYKRKKDANE